MHQGIDAGVWYGLYFYCMESLWLCYSSLINYKGLTERQRKVKVNFNKISQ